MGHYRNLKKRGSWLDSLEGSVTGIKEHDKEDNEFYDSDDFSDDSNGKKA